MTEEEIKKLEQEREERLAKMRALVEKSNEQAAVSIPFPTNNEDAPLEKIDFKDVANPEESYKLYYQIQNILKNNLPKGLDNATKKLREDIYEEKNVFLNRGKFKDANGIRHSDGRMTFIDPFLTEALNIVLTWVANGAQPFDIFVAFYDKNKELGYYD
jgi:hypothetical protein